MKSFIAATAILALAGSALAAPSGMKFGKRQGGQASDPGQQATIAAIQQWNIDVAAVNNFLNTVPAFTQEYLNLAEQTLDFANNEPIQLGILANVFGINDAAIAAVADLKNVFPDVPAQLEQIIVDVQNNAIADIQDRLLFINSDRCCNVLPDLDVLWSEAAFTEGAGTSVNLVVPRPLACPTIACANGNNQ